MTVGEPHEWWTVREKLPVYPYWYNGVSDLFSAEA